MSENMVEISVADLDDLENIVTDLVVKSIGYEKYFVEEILGCSNNGRIDIEIDDCMMDDPEYFLRILGDIGEGIDERFVDIREKNGLDIRKNLVEDMIATDTDILIATDDDIPF